MPVLGDYPTPQEREEFPWEHRAVHRVFGVNAALGLVAGEPREILPAPERGSLGKTPASERKRCWGILLPGAYLQMSASQRCLARGTGGQRASMEESTVAGLPGSFT